MKVRGEEVNRTFIPRTSFFVPYAYGLALAGQQGVYEVLRNFMAGFELTMGLAGCKNILEIDQKSLKVAF